MTEEIDSKSATFSDMSTAFRLVAGLLARDDVTDWLKLINSLLAPRDGGALMSAESVREIIHKGDHVHPFDDAIIRQIILSDMRHSACIIGANQAWMADPTRDTSVGTSSEVMAETAEHSRLLRHLSVWLNPTKAEFNWADAVQAGHEQYRQMNPSAGSIAEAAE